MLLWALNFTEKFRKEVILRTKISGKEALSSSKGFPIQRKVSLLWRFPTIFLILAILRKDNLSPHATLYLLGYKSDLQKEFIILETERATMESVAKKKSCSNWNYGVAREIIRKVFLGACICVCVGGGGGGGGRGGVWVGVLPNWLNGYWWNFADMLVTHFTKNIIIFPGSVIKAQVSQFEISGSNIDYVDFFFLLFLTKKREKYCITWQYLFLWACQVKCVN